MDLGTSSRYRHNENDRPDERSVFENQGSDRLLLCCSTKVLTCINQHGIHLQELSKYAPDG